MSHEPPDPFTDDLRAQLNGYAQQAAALRRERDEERISRLAILERLTPACEMLLAKGDTDTFNVLTGNELHVPPVRRDVVEALREARAARDAKVRTERDNAWLSALETETVCAAPLTPRGMFDAVTSHDDRVHAAALEEAAEAGAFRVTDYDNVGVELEIIADRVRRAIQDIAATPSAAPAPERAKCKACGGTGNTGWPLRVTCAVCNGNGGTGEVK